MQRKQKRKRENPGNKDKAISGIERAKKKASERAPVKSVRPQGQPRPQLRLRPPGGSVLCSPGPRNRTPSRIFEHPYARRTERS